MTPLRGHCWLQSLMLTTGVKLKKGPGDFFPPQQFIENLEVSGQQSVFIFFFKLN